MKQDLLWLFQVISNTFWVFSGFCMQKSGEFHAPLPFNISQLRLKMQIFKNMHLKFYFQMIFEWEQSLQIE